MNDLLVRVVLEFVRTAQAVTVILDGNNVIRIENLPVTNQLEEVTVYNVDFVFDSGIGVYGSNFDFTFTQEEDAVLALKATMDALNANNPTPTGAGPVGTDQFFIGVEFDDTSQVPVIAALGGENILGLWDQCDTDCIGGAAVPQITDLR
jgi:hypothetical protein